MADNNQKERNGTWGRSLRRSLARFRVRSFAFPEEITDLAIAPHTPGFTDPDDPETYNKDFEESILPVGLEASTYYRQRSNYNRGNEILNQGFNDLSKSVSSSMWSNDSNAEISAAKDDFQKRGDRLLDKSGSSQCFKCGKVVPPSTLRPDFMYNKPVFVCKNGCKDWTNGNPNGAPRNYYQERD